MMKKLLFLLLIFPLFVACSDNDDEKELIQDETIKNEIIGEWNMESIEIKQIDISDNEIKSIVTDSIINKAPDRYAFTDTNKCYYFEDGKIVSFYVDYTIDKGDLIISSLQLKKILSIIKVDQKEMSYLYNATNDFKALYGNTVKNISLKFIYTREMY